MGGDPDVGEDAAALAVGAADRAGVARFADDDADDAAAAVAGARDMKDELLVEPVVAEEEGGGLIIPEFGGEGREVFAEEEDGGLDAIDGVPFAE